MDRLRVNGTELPYVEQGSGIPVVLVHGAWMDHRYWSRSETPSPTATASSHTTRAITEAIRGPMLATTTPWPCTPPIWPV